MRNKVYYALNKKTKALTPGPRIATAQIRVFPLIKTDDLAIQGREIKLKGIRKLYGFHSKLWGVQKAINVRQ